MTADTNGRVGGNGASGGLDRGSGSGGNGGRVGGFNGSGGGYRGYDYMELHVKDTMCSFYLDCYCCFGWFPDDNVISGSAASAGSNNLAAAALTRGTVLAGGTALARSAALAGGAARRGKRKLTRLCLKRSRAIANKTELTRLQRHFEACAAELSTLEKSKTTSALIWALTVGILGTAFMAGSTFAVTAEPPVIWLCCLLAVPGFLGWLLPYFIFKKIAALKTAQLAPIIEAKYDEVYEICRKGHSLL